MAEKEDGGPAFPNPKVWDDDKKEYGDCWTSSGMSLRDYFAGQAVIGVISHRDWEGDIVFCAEDAYRIADEMLKARKN